MQGYCDPNPTEYVDHQEADPNAVFYWGLSPIASHSIDIDSVKEDFLKSVNKDAYNDIGTNRCRLELSVVEISRLPKNLGWADAWGWLPGKEFQTITRCTHALLMSPSPISGMQDQIQKLDCCWGISNNLHLLRDCASACLGVETSLLWGFSSLLGSWYAQSLVLLLPVILILILVQMMFVAGDSSTGS